MEDKTVQNPISPNPIASVRREIETASGQITHSEPEINLPQEAREIGVEAVASKPELTLEHEEVGIRPSFEDARPNIAPEEVSQAPVVQQTHKVSEKANPEDSISWLMVLREKVEKMKQRLGLSGLKQKTA